MMMHQSFLTRQFSQIFDTRTFQIELHQKRTNTFQAPGCCPDTVTDTLLHTNCYTNFNYEMCNVRDCDNVGELLCMP